MILNSMKRNLHKQRVGLVAMALALAAGPALSQRPAGGQWVPTPAPKQTAPIVIVGGTVHIGDGRVLPSATVVLDGGKITAVSTEAVTPPAGATVIDAKGQHVYPGLIGVASQLGLIEIAAVRQTVDTDETGEVNANVRAISSYSTDSHVTPVVRSNGVLVAQVMPTGGTITGQSAIVQLDAWNYEDAAIVAEAALHVDWPVVRPNFFGAAAPEPGRDPQAEALRSLNEYFDQATAYAAARAAGKVTKTDLRLEAMVPYVTGQRPVFFHAEQAAAIEAAVEFAVRRKLRPVIMGGADAWRVPHLLVKHSVPVAIQCSQSLPARSDEDYDEAYKLAKRLKDAGVRFCVSNFNNEWYKIQSLPFLAGQLVPFGLTREEALTSVTLDAARVLGIEQRLGSIEVGKDATVVISAGDLLDMRSSQVVEAIIGGRRIDLSNKHKALYHRFQQKYGER